jgi:hypothetical protein
MRLLIGHWKKGLAREEQHPPSAKIGLPVPQRKAGQMFTFGS